MYGSSDAVGVYGTGGNGVIGESTAGTGVWGKAAQGFGVVGESATGTGVRGLTDTGRAVDGLASNGGVGVYGNNLGSNTKGYAGDFFGRVRVRGDLVLETGSFGGAIRFPGAGVGTSTAAFIHISTPASTSQLHWATQIDHPLTNGDPNAILIVTHNGQRSSSGFAQEPFTVIYNSGKWFISNEDSTSDMRVGQAFNVLASYGGHSLSPPHGWTMVRPRQC